MMTDQHYDLFFNGQTLPGHAVDEVMQALKSNLKLSDQYLDNLFSGNEVRLKKQVDKATAIKFQQAFKVSGAKLIVKQHVVESPTSPPNATTPSQPEPSKPEIHTPNSTDDALATKPHQPDLTAPKHTPDWEIAAPGATLVEPKREEAPSEFDLEHLSLADPGASLTHPGFEPPAPIIDVSHLELSSNDGNIETLKPKQKAVQVDISHLNIENT